MFRHVGYFVIARWCLLLDILSGWSHCNAARTCLI